MNILISSVHPALFEAQLKVLCKLGHKLFVPTVSNMFGYGQTYDESISRLPETLKPVLHKIDFQTLNSSGIDLVWCSCFDQLVKARLLAEDLKAKLLLYACNNNTPYRSTDGDYLLSEDFATFVNAPIKHKQYVVFPPNKDHFWSNDFLKRDLTVVTLINRYERYPEHYNFYKQIANTYQNKFTFHWLNNVHDRNEVAHALKTAYCLLHLKPEEASGNSMMEALACNTPVVVNEDLLQGRTCGLFLIPGFNCHTIRMGHVEDFGLVKAVPYGGIAGNLREFTNQAKCQHIVNDFLTKIQRG